jgi:hypothetical protein
MQPSTYRLTSETLGIARKKDHPVLVTLREGSRVMISNAEAGSRMIDVVWEGKVITIFAQDLDERGILEAKPLASEAPPKTQSKTA